MPFPGSQCKEAEAKDRNGNERLAVIDGDTTDPDCIKGLEELEFDTVINCAACVKHFAESEYLMRINVNGVDNLIDLCIKKKGQADQPASSYEKKAAISSK